MAIVQQLVIFVSNLWLLCGWSWAFIWLQIPQKELATHFLCGISKNVNPKQINEFYYLSVILITRIVYAPSCLFSIKKDACYWLVSEYWSPLFKEKIGHPEFYNCQLWTSIFCLGSMQYFHNLSVAEVGRDSNLHVLPLENCNTVDEPYHWSTIYIVMLYVAQSLPSRKIRID